VLIINPEPRLLCLYFLSGMSPPKNLLKKSSLPKNSSKGEFLNWDHGETPPPVVTILVVLILTTAGFSFSAKSAKDMTGISVLDANKAAETSLLNNDDKGLVDPTG
jgi:hypothetical protein